ncbi:MAG: hypothetical protein RL198_324 [Actinomycetota bacterium]|jgi:hypothetical protein
MRRFANLTSYLIFAGVAAVFVGGLVFAAVRSLETALIWGLVAFIACIVLVATIDLMVPPDDRDPNTPRLS